MVFRMVFITLLCIAFISSCSSQKESAEHKFRIFEENGVTIAETTGGPKHDGELFRYEEILRLNQDETMAESLLARPSSVLIDESGSFYVLDSRTNRIVCYDRIGNYSHTIGNQGEGPGEFRRPILECLYNGLLVVRDFSLQRVSWFNTDGTFIDSSPLPAHPRMTVQQVRVGPGGEVILLGDFQYLPQNAYRYHTAVAVVYSAEGDSLSTIVSDSTAVGFTFRIEEFRQTSFAQIYFSTYPRVLYHPAHGLVLSEGEKPVIQCFNLTGRLQKEIRLDIPPVPVTGEDRQRVRTYHRNRILEAENESSRTVRERILERIEFQEFKAFFTIQNIAPSGYLWASAPQTGVPTDTEISGLLPTMVFSPAGEYLGNTRLPGRALSLASQYVVGIEEDESTGANDVVVYKIKPVVDGFVYP